MKLNNLRAVKETIREKGLEINESKSVYNVEKVKFLGHVVSTTGIYPDPDKVKDIKSFRAPQGNDELQSLLGLATFVGRFIPNLSSVTSPLRELLRKNAVFEWQKIHQVALDKIKEFLTDDKYLSYFDEKKKTILIADAGPMALRRSLVTRRRRRILDHFVCVESAFRDRKEVLPNGKRSTSASLGV